MLYLMLLLGGQNSLHQRKGNSDRELLPTLPRRPSVATPSARRGI